jgi:pyruvate ferredoxin oxidoreductase delta subunit
MEIKAGRLVDPCSTRITKTGAWRTFVPVVDHEKCIKCSLCEIYCPEGCIHQVHSGDVEILEKYGYSPEQIAALPKDETIFVPDLNYCKGCSVCAHECPRKAIEMVLEEK